MMTLRSTFFLLLLLMLPISNTFAAPAASPIVISQIYGGGGNPGATYTHDFVELFNRGVAPVNLAGWSVQYSSSTSTTWTVTILGGTIQPGRYFLIQMAQGGGGTTALPTPDVIGNTSMGATGGKVVLVESTTALAGACPTDATIRDLVGYGSSASCYEGSSPAPTLSNTTAARRAEAGCQDIDDNSVDFGSGSPEPRNSASPSMSCAAPTALTLSGQRATATAPALLFGFLLMVMVHQIAIKRPVLICRSRF